MGSPNMFGQGGMGSRSHPNKIYGHSNPNGMNFNGFNGGGSMADEQLLEGLGEEPKLFWYLNLNWILKNECFIYKLGDFIPAL